MPTLTIEEFKDRKIVNWLYQNRNKFDIRLPFCTPETHISNAPHPVQPISDMFPPAIRPVMISRQKDEANNNRPSAHVSDDEDAGEGKAKKNEYVEVKEYPKDLGSFKVTGGKQKSCNGRLVNSIEDSSHLLLGMEISITVACYTTCTLLSFRLRSSDEAALYEKFRKVRSITLSSSTH